jgi:hypothetical protein
MWVLLLLDGVRESSKRMLVKRVAYVWFMTCEGYCGCLVESSSHGASIAGHSQLILSMGHHRGPIRIIKFSAIHQRKKHPLRENTGVTPV